MSVIDVASQVLRDEAQAILDLIGKLNGNFETAVEMIHHSRGRVVVTGMGKSGHIARKVAATMPVRERRPFSFTRQKAYMEIWHGDIGRYCGGLLQQRGNC